MNEIHTVKGGTLKKLIVAVVLALLAGGGVYYFASNRNSSNNQKIEGNALVQKVLDKVKSETPTVEHTRIFTESTDANNLLGKKGEYQYAGSFYDMRTGYKAQDDSGNDIDISKDSYGADAGGTIEVFASEADAKKRGGYLEAIQSSPGFLGGGASEVVGKAVLRVSSDYTASQQQEMLKLIESALN